LEWGIYQVTPAKCKLFDPLFQHREQQLLQEVGTKATGRRSIFNKELAIRKPATEDEDYRAANMTTDKRLPFQNRVSDTSTEPTSWSLADSERVTNQLEREISWHQLE
jgi:hypothetical protein